MSLKLSVYILINCLLVNVTCMRLTFETLLFVWCTSWQLFVRCFSNVQSLILLKLHINYICINVEQVVCYTISDVSFAILLLSFFFLTLPPLNKCKLIIFQLMFRARTIPLVLSFWQVVLGAGQVDILSFVKFTAFNALFLCFYHAIWWAGRVEVLIISMALHWVKIIGSNLILTICI